MASLKSVSEKIVNKAAFGDGDVTNADHIPMLEVVLAALPWRENADLAALVFHALLQHDEVLEALDGRL